MNRYIVRVPFNPNRIGNFLNQGCHFLQESQSAKINVGFTKIKKQEVFEGNMSALIRITDIDTRFGGKCLEGFFKGNRFLLFVYGRPFTIAAASAR